MAYNAEHSAEEALHSFLEGFDELEDFDRKAPGDQLGLYCSLADPVRPDVVKYLLQHGADANHRYNGNTPLFEICLRSRIEKRNFDEMFATTNTLIEHGADVNARSSPSNGAMTVLYSALDYGTECCPARIIQALLAAGANPLAEELGGIPNDEWPCVPGSPVYTAVSDDDDDGNGFCTNRPDISSCTNYTGYGYSNITDWSYFTSADISDAERFVRARQLESPSRRITSAIEMVKDFPINSDGVPMPGVPDDVRAAIEEAAAWLQSVQCSWIVCMTAGV